MSEKLREILFRGKRIDNSKWIEGFFVNLPLVHCNRTEPLITSGETGTSYEVDPETVGQFTGLTDKNGKRIFEGDIIEFHKFRGEPDWVGVIGYEHCQHMVTGRIPDAYEKRIGEEPFHCQFEVSLSGIDEDTIKVIGNIHDKPEPPEEVTNV